ncbi:MAG TPA: hypothetical protein VIN03_13860 [Roseateles sp.]
MATPVSASASAAAEAEKEPKVDWFARSAAVIAILLSSGGLWFNYWKGKRDRRLSVEDDFWLRKLISPTVIEPLLEKMIELMDDIPATSAGDEARRDYAAKVSAEVHRLQVSVKMLSLYHTCLPDELGQRLRNCEDLLTGYMGDVANALAEGKSVPAGNDVREKVWSEVIAAMAKIREIQQAHK